MNVQNTKYLIFDTETANGLDCPLVYDIGYAIIDSTGKIYDSSSMIIYDIFVLEKKLMESAYYAEKIPRYQEKINNNETTFHNFQTAKNKIAKVCKQWNVKGIVAHNAFFDYNSTNVTLRFLTKSKQRYFLPFGIPILDTLKMAKQAILPMAEYQEFCKKHDFLLSDGKRCRATAEVLYAFISNNPLFSESHTGLEDVMIEKEIFAFCIKQKKDVPKELFKPREIVANTKIQRQIMKAIRGY